jgi:hypothetical protein
MMNHRLTNGTGTALLTFHNRPLAGLISRPQSLETQAMTEASRVAKPKAEELPADLVELVEAVGRLSGSDRAEVDTILAKVVDSTRRRRRILNLVQDALGQLRLDMKYLMFDLEATRRERDEYRRKLEEKA